MSADDPKILAFDTSGPACLAGLITSARAQPGQSSTGPVATRIEDMARGQAERLMPMLEEFLAEHGLTWQDLDAIGVGIGPGNFTGIRISVSAARGLAMGLGIPAVGVSAFEAASLTSTFPYYVAVPAPREHVYLSRFDAGHATAPKLIAASDVADLDAPVIDAGKVPARERISNMTQIALMRHANVSQPPTPLYVKPADAAPPRDPAPVILE